MMALCGLPIFTQLWVYLAWAIQNVVDFFSQHSVGCLKVKQSSCMERSFFIHLKASFTSSIMPVCYQIFNLLVIDVVINVVVVFVVERFDIVIFA